MDLAAIAIKNRVVTLTMTVVMLAAGVSSYEKMSRLEDPEFTIKDALVMTPYPGMEAEHIAITGWSRIDKFPVEEYTRERVEEFIDAHERRFNPEGF